MAGLKGKQRVSKKTKPLKKSTKRKKISGTSLFAKALKDVYSKDRVEELLDWREDLLNFPVDPDGKPDYKGMIVAECTDIELLLLEKNRSYGSSAFEPIRIFSKADAEEQLLVRIDDKLSRIARGKEFQSEDTIQDLIGYLILLKIQRKINIKHK